MIFYQGDYLRQMEAVQRGEVDLGFMLGGWMEANYPQNIPLFNTLATKRVVYQSEPYPFLTSTEVVPAFGLSASPDIPWTLQQEILTALAALNATSPAALSAGIARFTLSASYEPARRVGQDVGVLYAAGPENTTCHSPFEDPYAFVFCPPGFVRDSPAAIDAGCARRGLYCPPGLVCLCRPCIPVLAVNVFPWQVVLGLCVALFAAGLLLSLGWRAALEAPHVPLPGSRRRAPAAWKEARV